MTIGAKTTIASRILRATGTRLLKRTAALAGSSGERRLEEGDDRAVVGPQIVELDLSAVNPLDTALSMVEEVIRRLEEVDGIGAKVHRNNDPGADLRRHLGR